jgi:hypothetical protein
MPQTTPPERKQKLTRYGVLFIRYGIGTIVAIAGVVLLIVSPGGLGVEGFGLLTGAGLSILALNFLYRLSLSGDEERQREEEARRYLAEHGRWPDEEPRESSRGAAGASQAGAAGGSEAGAAGGSEAPPEQRDHGEHRDGAPGHDDHASRRPGLARDRGPRHRRRGAG